MTSVLMAIKPKWCELIFSGKKTVELRKTKPKQLTPIKVYVYCTKPSQSSLFRAGGTVLSNDELYRLPNGDLRYGNSIELVLQDGVFGPSNFLNGKVVGEIICEDIDVLTVPREPPYSIRTAATLSSACLKPEEARTYFGGNMGYAWHITGAKLYDKPKALTDFRRVCANDLYCENCAMFNNYTNVCGNAALVLKRAPQSWCYVEEVAG